MVLLGDQEETIGTARYGVAGAGIQTAALAFGGHLQTRSITTCNRRI
jgi:hypothetical protein